MDKYNYVYILASKTNGTLYIGVTCDIAGRIWEHKNDFDKGFTFKNNVKRLVHYEVYDDINLAIDREKQLKAWRRKWKLDLIESENPFWDDLYEEVLL